MPQKEILGIDVGATGMKGALVNIETGALTTERFRLLTPQPADPVNMSETFKEIVSEFDYSGPVGCGFPAVIKHNKALKPQTKASSHYFGQGTIAMEYFNKIVQQYSNEDK